MKVTRNLDSLFMLIVGLLVGATVMGITTAFISPAAQVQEDLIFYKNENERLKDINFQLQVDATICTQLELDCQELLEAAKAYRHKVEERWGKQLE